MLALAGACAAEPIYSFAKTPGKLPKTVVPTHYSIELEPNLDSLAIAGTEIIDIDVREATAQLVLNAVNMTLARATVDDGAQSATIAVDQETQTATLTFPAPLAVGTHKLRIDFTAQINKFGRGLFFVDYPTEQGSKRMISSHLEPADARRIFPCWDEPAFKATFALTVTLPRKFLAVSNMPVSREEPVTPDAEAGLVRHHAEDVELPVRARGRRARTPHRPCRRRHRQRGHHRRQARAGTLRARHRRSICCATSTTISA